MDDTLIIERQFNGPRLSGNGGYVGGVLAGRFTRGFGGDGTVEITLRAPIPIGRALQVVRDGNALLLRDGDTLICEARAGSVAHLEPPPAPTDWDDVLSRAETGGSPEDSDFTWCVVCGRKRGGPFERSAVHRPWGAADRRGRADRGSGRAGAVAARHLEHGKAPGSAPRPFS